MSKRKISRRDFLKTTAAGAAAAGMASVTSRAFLRDLFPPVKAQEPIPINSAVVIGGGLAGLTTAMLLTDMGKDVTVLEKCHIPGGRVQGHTYPDGMHGVVSWSEWFDQWTDPDVWWLINELGFAKKDIFKWPADTFYWWRGQYNFDTWTKMVPNLPWDDPEGADDCFAFDNEVGGIGLLMEPWEGTEYENYDYTDFEDWMLERHRSDVTEFANMSMSSEVAAPISQASAGLGIYSWYYWSNSNCYNLMEGNYQVIERLCSRIPPGSLHLNEAIKSVENTATGVQVEADHNTYTADVAIVAVDHPSVAGIVPELPSERVAALQALGQLKSIKAFQQYTEEFWKTVHGMDGWGGYTDYIMCVTDESMHQPGTKGVLGQYLNEPASSNNWAPRKGIHINTAARNRITDRILAELDEFWQASQYFIDGSQYVFEWMPYVPIFEPRYVLDGTYVLNRQPIDKIFFAGDYIYDAGVESAIASARDVVANFT